MPVRAGRFRDTRRLGIRPQGLLQVVEQLLSRLQLLGGQMVRSCNARLGLFSLRRIALRSFDVGSELMCQKNDIYFL